jgi:hypothetical protein
MVTFTFLAGHDHVIFEEAQKIDVVIGRRPIFMAMHLRKMLNSIVARLVWDGRSRNHRRLLLVEGAV